MTLPRETIADAFWRCVEEQPNQPAVFTFADGVTRAYSWREIAEQVTRASANLQACKLQPGDRIAQLSENRYEWLVADLAILLLGGVHAPIHAQLPATAVRQQIVDSGAQVLIVSNDQQWQRIATELHLPELAILSHDDCQAATIGGSVQVVRHKLLGEVSTDASAVAAQQLAIRRTEIQPESPATLLYTSGTVGEPRGVLLSHRNLFCNAQALIDAFAPQRHLRRLNFLPLSHIFARTCDWYVTIVSGTQVGLATSRESILADCQRFKPQVLNGVPYFFDKVRRSLVEIDDQPETTILPGMLGGELQLCNVGGAALPDHVFDFYRERGITLCQGYGLTEAAPVVTLSTEQQVRRGSVGRPVPGVEVRLAEDGEILTRGPNVMLGYWHDELATQNVLQSGWLHTGDLGHFDDDGFLYVTGRCKELIVLASGKKVQPAAIESRLTAEPLILQAFVAGEGKNFLTALIVPDFELLVPMVQRHFIVFSPDVQEHPTVQGWFATAVERALVGLAPWEQVKKFKLLGRGFTIERGELTPKLSLRRDVIAEHLNEELEKLYRS